MGIIMELEGMACAICKYRTEDFFFPYYFDLEPTKTFKRALLALLVY